MTNSVVLTFLEKQPIARKSNDTFYPIGIIRNERLYIIQLPREFSNIIPEWSFLKFQEHSEPQDSDKP